MKAYIRPQMIVEPLAINPHPVEYSWGTDWTIDHTIPAGDVELQTKGTHEEWGAIW